MRRRHVPRSTKDTIIPFLGTFLRILLRFDKIAGSVQPPLALNALDDQIALAVRLVTARTVEVRRAGAAFRPTVHPGAVEAGIGSAASLTDGAPLTLPVAVRDIVQWRIHAVNVIGNVAVIAQNQTAFVITLAAALAYRTVQASKGKTL